MGRDRSAPGVPILPRHGESSFGESQYNFGEPTEFCLEGWRAFVRYHQGDNDIPIQEAPVLARLRNFLERQYGEN